MELIDTDGSIDGLEGLNDLDSGLSESESGAFDAGDEVVAHGILLANLG